MAHSIPAQHHPGRGRALYPFRDSGNAGLRAARRHQQDRANANDRSDQAPFYIFTAFVFSYGTTTLGTSRNFLLIAVMVAAVISFFTIPYSGHLSDRIGRTRMYLIGAAVTGVFGFIYFALLNTMVPGLIFLAIVLSLIPHDMMYGPQAAMIAECFTARLRYSGASLGYQLASIIAGGPAPLIATALLAKYHSGYAIAAFILVCALISLVSTAMLKDHTNLDISYEYDAEPAR
jgi:MFS family permease